MAMMPTHSSGLYPASLESKVQRGWFCPVGPAFTLSGLPLAACLYLNQGGRLDWLACAGSCVYPRCLGVMGKIYPIHSTWPGSGRGWYSQRKSAPFNPKIKHQASSTVLLLGSFHRWRDWGSENLCNLFQDLTTGSARAITPLSFHYLASFRPVLIHDRSCLSCIYYAFPLAWVPTVCLWTTEASNQTRSNPVTWVGG